jgi:hypothetical protein
LVIELVAGEVAELILHPDHPSLGAKHDQVEANAFARVAVAATPAVAALLAYCEAEAVALIRANIEIVDALVEALIEAGTCGSPFRFTTIRNYLLNAPALRVRAHRDFQPETHRVQNA